MITGEQLQQARSKARMTQEELAVAVGVTLRSVGNWERGAGVPRNREGTVRDILGQFLAGDQQVDSLSSASDLALLAELGRRLDRARLQGGSNEVGSTEAEKTVELPPAPVVTHPRFQAKGGDGTIELDELEGAARSGYVKHNPQLAGQEAAGEDNQDEGGFDPA